MAYRIKDIREDNDLLQKDMAEIIKTTQQQYSKIELGRSDIYGEKVVLIAKKFNLSADYILGLIDEPRPLK
ncbi:MAG: helix-turn-helix transcriptional regulator [Clostridia bacterium]|nr:helix-turn-helix transcriptional regulator [Clostridia bacterium]